MLTCPADIQFVFPRAMPLVRDAETMTHESAFAGSK